jgi:hypothetical protein
MKTCQQILAASVAVLCLWSNSSARAQAVSHIHIYAGVSNEIPYNPQPGTPLWFKNGTAWDIHSNGGDSQSPACIYLDNNYPAVYPGQYQTATTFVGLAATFYSGGIPDPDAASPGTYIELRFVSLQGPAGGTLTIWDENIDPLNPPVMLSVPVGTTNGQDRMNLSQGDPMDPGSDPYGHIHNRRITVDKPGLYVVGLQLLDTSNNGPDGGPVHTPSTTNYFYFQAGLWLSDFSRSNGVAMARFGLPNYSTNFVFEASTNLARTNWTASQNISGQNQLMWVTDTNATTPSRFYRLRMGKD